jgi:uncharacterized protein YecE (DUF72 family)
MKRWTEGGGDGHHDTLYEQVGLVVGTLTVLVGFVWAQLPPEMKSSTAASYAAPQFGSLAPPLALLKYEHASWLRQSCVL